VLGTRGVDNDLILVDCGFSDKFPQYYQFMRTAWAKLFSLTVILRYKEERCPNVPYGWDTLFTQEAFRNSERVGIFAESLHKYYLNQKSASYIWQKQRIYADRLLLDSAHDFLISKTGHVSPRNKEFLLVVYMNAIKDTLSVLLNVDIPESEKISGVIDIFSHEYTKQLAAQAKFYSFPIESQAMIESRRALFSAAAEWLLAREEVPDDQIEAFCATGEFLCAACENAGGWLFFKRLLARFLIDAGRADEAKDKLDELAKLFSKDSDAQC
jgi:hypothetical protein